MGQHIDSSRVVLLDILAQMQDALKRFGELHSKYYELLPESSTSAQEGPSLSIDVPDLTESEVSEPICKASGSRFWAKIT